MDNMETCALSWIRLSWRLRTDRVSCIQLSSTSVDENSDVDTTVGKLSTSDPDTSQSFTYQLLSNAAGRFKVVNNLIKVSGS